MAYRMIEDFEDYTDFTAFNTDTTTVAASTSSVTGTNALSFAKVDGAANTVFGAAYKTLTDVDLKDAKLSDYICWECYVSAVTDVAYAFVRLGTDASNYAEWRFADSSLVAGRFTFCSAKVGDQYVTGTGIDWDDVTYLCIGAAFDAAGNALAGVLVDSLMFHKAILTA